MLFLKAIEEIKRQNQSAFARGTPRSHHPHLTPQEIESYLVERFGAEESKWPPFAIVDDKQVVPEGHAWSPRFIKTEPQVGLTETHAAALLAALKHQVPEPAAP